MLLPARIEEIPIPLPHWAHAVATHYSRALRYDELAEETGKWEFFEKANDERAKAKAILEKKA